MENFNVGRDPSQGWVIWVETLNEAFYKCRDPKKYSISRKTKNIDEYKSTTCATVKMLQKYPEKSGEYIEYTYSRADIAAKETLKWIMYVDDVKYPWIPNAGTRGCGNLLRVGEKETFTQPLSDKSIQDCFSNNPLSLHEMPQRTLIFLQHPPKNRTLYEHYWNGELLSSGIPVKDSIDPAKEEPENDLGTESENHCLCKENCDLRNHAIGVYFIKDQMKGTNHIDQVPPVS
ncbi:DNA polymerase [Trichonephila inaurata madagascariensis]|uniref:DNA polymerase n=1 Tax=Trichonephila inaurata madagascariensis TaxID=2747483 RepID=A0A8X6Y2P7_9ARAC|nr:DNA polymerase [Trichonephila inaurata madagascariensis]